MEREQILLVTGDDALADVVLAAAAALRREVTLVTTAAEAVASWDQAVLVLVGSDRAAEMAGLAPGSRAGVFLVGFAPEALAPWSVRLQAPVIVVPEALSTLSAVLADDRGRGGPVVGVLGGSGGIGASTLAAGLAMAARRSGKTAALVDLDPIGGGVDLLLGAERTPGWRWSRLVGARGEVNDVRRFLPQVEGLTVVSMGREPRERREPEVPSVESVKAVLSSLARHHDLVVIDPGRASTPSLRTALAACRLTYVVSGTGVRAVAACAERLRGLDLTEPSVVVRRQPSSRVAPEVVGRALALPVSGVVPDDHRLALLAERGDPPGRTGRGAWAKAVDALAARAGEVSDAR